MTANQPTPPSERILSLMDDVTNAANTIRALVRSGCPVKRRDVEQIEEAVSYLNTVGAHLEER